MGVIYGDTVVIVCTTTTEVGRIEWMINDIDMYLIDSGAAVNANVVGSSEHFTSHIWQRAYVLYSAVCDS